MTRYVIEIGACYCLPGLPNTRRFGYFPDVYGFATSVRLGL